MQLEIGQIYEGHVKNITQYGAFVEVTAINEAGASVTVTGMVHISEVANTFVRDIHDFLKEDDTVRVKVLGVNPQGKISFSIKQAMPNEGQASGEGGQQKRRPRENRDAQKPRVYEPKKHIPQSEMSFEDMMLHFKQCSEENICDLKRGSERKGGSRSRK